tara:strand:+ start:10401 stop:12908 length:2508 start_codon:yes stop_codon:yes gene_type:complete
MGGIKTISIIVAANIKGLEQGLGKANKSLAGFASKAARMGSMLSFGITAPLTALGKSALNTFANFEDSMTKVAAVTGATEREFKALTDSAKTLGATTRYTAQQFAELQLVLGRKGFNPREINNMTKAVSDLALATGEDLTLAAETVSTSINAFQLGSGEAARVANTLASAAANSSIQLSTFSTAFGHAGASANAVGMDLEELAAMMGVLMDNGIKASKAGTGLRKIFMKLHKEGRDFTEVLDLVTQGELGLERAMKLAGVTSANQLLILAENKDKVAQLTEEYHTNTGALKAMTDLMGKTTKQKLLIMDSAINSMKMEIGALLAEALLPMIYKITELASAFQGLAPETKDMILKVTAIAAVVGPLLLTLSLMAAGVGMLGTAFGALGAIIPFSIAGMSAFGILLGESVVAAYAASGGMAALSAGFEVLTLAIASNPLGAVAVALAAIGVALYAYMSQTEDASDVLNDDFNPATKTAADRLSEINRQLDNFGKSSLQLTAEELSESIAGIKEEIEEVESLTRGFMSAQGSSDAQINAFLRQEESLIELKKLLNGYEESLDRVNAKIKGDTTPTVKTLNDPKVANDVEDDFEIEEIELNISIPPSAEDELKSFGEKLEESTVSWASKIESFAAKWGEAIGMVGDIFGQMIENKSIALDNAYAKDLTAINNSTMAEQDKVDAIKKLDADLATEKKKLQKKQAIADKIAALISATINGAVAITKVAGQTGIGAIKAAPMMAALVGAQIAAIAAQPIPQFANGGNPSIGKVSMVGERGPELFVPKQAGTIIPNAMLGGGNGGVQRVEVFGTLDAEGIQIATIKGNEIAMEKGGKTLRRHQ